MNGNFRSTIGEMEPKTPLESAISAVGLTKLAKALGVTHQAIRKWERAGRLPRTEWTGETKYAETIERICPGVTKAQLLSPWVEVAAT